MILWNGGEAMEILSQHTVDIQQHCAVFDKAPVAFAMFRLILGKTGDRTPRLSNGIS